MIFLEEYESYNFQLIRISNRKLNQIRTGANESKKHKELKHKVCEYLHNKNHNFVTEAIFVKGGRADVFDLTDATVYEIMVSEKDASVEAKSLYYPNHVNIIMVKQNGNEDIFNTI